MNDTIYSAKGLIFAYCEADLHRMPLFEHYKVLGNRRMGGECKHVKIPAYRKYASHFSGVLGYSSPFPKTVYGFQQYFMDQESMQLRSGSQIWHFLVLVFVSEIINIIFDDGMYKCIPIITAYDVTYCGINFISNVLYKMLPLVNY